MQQPAKWWIGLLPLAIIWILANVVRDASVETDLQSKTDRAIARVPMGVVDGAKASVAGRDVTLSGTIFSPAADAPLTASVDDLWGVRRVGGTFQMPPAAHPYVFSAAHDGSRIVLSGNVPSPTAKAKRVADAKSAWPNAEIVDKLAYAGGEPISFAAATAYGLTEAAKLDNGTVSLSDSTYSIAGAAATSAVYDAALAATKTLPPGETLGKAEILAPEAHPFMWQATKVDGIVTLSGVVPSDEARQAIAAKAATLFPGMRIVDTMTIARGVPAGDFVATSSFLLGELVKLADGKAALSDAMLSLEGEAPDGATKSAIEDEMRSALPAGSKAGTVALTEAPVSPYTFKIEKGDDGTVHLTGDVPDDKTRQAIVAAKAQFFDAKIVDDLKIGAGAPANFQSAVIGAMPGLARLAGGTMSLSDSTITVTGEAIYAKAADEIKAAIKGSAPPGFTIDPTIGVKPAGPALEPPACQPKFEDLLAKGHIRFETGSAVLSKDSIPLLDGLVGVALRCQTANIEISGHTDTVGAAESNLELSRRRSAAVVAYLANAGVDTSRITSAGYGQEKPIASNDTAEGRAKNRRIEFQVK